MRFSPWFVLFVADDWLLDNALLAQLYASRVLAGASLSHEDVYLQFVNEKIGYGLFALRKIKAGSYIGALDNI